MRRRRFVLATSLAATTALAGCLGGGSGSNGPESVVVNFYESGANAGSAQETVDLLDEFFHTESPLFEFYEMAATNETIGGNFTTQTVETVDTEILTEDLNAEQLTEEYSLQSVYDISDELLEALAEENARVSADVTYTDTDNRSSEFLTVTENGNWVIFL